MKNYYSHFGGFIIKINGFYHYHPYHNQCDYDQEIVNLIDSYDLGIKCKFYVIHKHYENNQTALKNACRQILNTHIYYLVDNGDLKHHLKAIFDDNSDVGFCASSKKRRIEKFKDDIQSKIKMLNNIKDNTKIKYLRENIRVIPPLIDIILNYVFPSYILKIYKLSEVNF